MRTFDALSPYDFEQLVQDLLHAHWGVHVELFMPGPDKGIDLRVFAPSGQNTLIQCKRYAPHAFNKLHSKLREERSKVAALQPDRYIVATTVPLSVDRKEKLVDALSPWVRSPADILGAEDLNLLLRTYPDVEKTHYKLWLNSTAVLERLLNNDVVVRTAGYMEDMRRKSKIYVRNSSFSEALQLLDEVHACLISGPPGVGKTTLADILLLHLIAKGFQPVIVSEDVSEADRTYLPGKPQVFLYDDFLGRSSSFERLGKNEDDRLLRFISRVQQAEAKRFILTTREYLLRNARAGFERLADPKIDLSKITVDVSDYTRLHRAHILYNHLYFSSLPTEALENVVRERAYRQVIGHKNYLPRLVDDAVSLAQQQNVEPDKFPAFLENAFDRPEELWRNILLRQFRFSEQVLLLMLLAVGARAPISILEQCYLSVYIDEQLTPFDDALRAVEGTAVEVGDRSAWLGTPTADYINPGVQDAVIKWLAGNPRLLRVAISACRSFEQLLLLWVHSLESVPSLRWSTFKDDEGSVRHLRKFLRMEWGRWPSTARRREFRHAIRANGELMVKLLMEYMLSGPASGMSAEEHMVFVVRISSDLRGGLSRGEWQSLADYLLSRWSTGRGNKDDAVDLIEILLEHEVVPRDIRSALAEGTTAWFAGSRRVTHDFALLKTLRTLLSQDESVLAERLFDLPELADLADEYLGIIDDEIAVIEAWESSATEADSALDEIVALGVELGIDDVEARTEFARELVREWLAEEGDPNWEPDEDWRGEQDETSSDDVDDLFESLTD